MRDIQAELDENRRKVDVDYFDLTVREIIRMVAEGELRTAPDYQRKFRWTADDESKLIESLFLGLPVPSIFVAANPDGTWEVVDGLQRVSTIVHFAASTAADLSRVARQEYLRLSDLHKLTGLSHKTLAELPTPLQLGFYKRMLRVTALSDKSDLNVRFDLFERLNTGGIALSAQEVRACIYQGPFIDLIDRLAGDPVFKSLLKLQTSKDNDGTKEEIVLRMFAYLYGRDQFDGKVTTFLNTFAGEDGPKYDSATLANLFHTTINSLATATGGAIKRNGVATTPINQLEGILVGAAELVSSGITAFSPRTNWINDAELVHFSTKGTNTKRMLNGRIDRARKLLEGAEVKTSYSGVE